MPPKQHLKRKEARHIASIKNGYHGLFSCSSMIARIDATEITPEQFYRQYIYTRTPVILTNLDRTSDFVGVQKWSNSYLSERAGEKELQIEHRKSKTANFGREAPRESMLFKTFLQGLQNGNDMHYLTSQTSNYEGNDLPDLLAEPLSSLVNDMTVSPQIMGNLVPYQCNLWMGNTVNGSTSGLHHDYHDNLYYLLRGVKVFNIFSPVDCFGLSLQGQVAKIQPNGLLVYKSAPAINQNCIPGIDMYSFCHHFTKKLLKWTEIFNVIVKNQEKSSKKEEQNQLELSQIDIDLLLATKPLKEAQNYITTLLNHSKIDLIQIPTKTIQNVILPRIEYWTEKLFEQRLFLEAEYDFNSDDDGNSSDEEKSSTIIEKSLKSAENTTNSSNEDDTFGSYFDSDEEFFNDSEHDFDDIPHHRKSHSKAFPISRKGSKLVQLSSKNNSNKLSQQKQIEQKIDEEIFPHFSRVPLPLLYDLAPKYPPTFCELAKFGSNTPQSEILYTTIHSTVCKTQDNKASLNTILQLKQQQPELQAALETCTKSTAVLMPNEALFLPASYFHEVRSFNIPTEKLAAIVTENGDGADDLLKTLDQLDQKEFGGHMALNYWFFPPNRPVLTDEITDPAVLFENPYGDSLYWQHLWAKTYAKSYPLNIHKHDPAISQNDKETEIDNCKKNTDCSDDIIPVGKSLTDNALKIDDKYAGMTAIQRLMAQQKEITASVPHMKRESSVTTKTKIMKK